MAGYRDSQTFAPLEIRARALHPTPLPILQGAMRYAPALLLYAHPIYALFAPALRPWKSGARAPHAVLRPRAWCVRFLETNSNFTVPAVGYCK